MAGSTKRKVQLRTQQKSLFVRRIQVTLMGVIAVSAIEHSAKRSERLEADRNSQHLAKTALPRKSTVPSIQPVQPKSPSNLALKPNKALSKTAK